MLTMRGELVLQAAALVAALGVAGLLVWHLLCRCAA
jgi:hypothetical protein